jgi:N-acetylmuramoyl-L-alanine amidase
MKKRILFVALVLSTLMLIAAAPSSASSWITVTLDGKNFSFDVPPQLINGRAMVPLRAIFEAMGVTAGWDGNAQMVTGTKGDTVVILTIGSTSPTINGRVVTIDQPGVVIDNRTLAPLRFVAETFGSTVAWDENTQTASITMGGTATTSILPIGNNSHVGS